MGVNKNHLKMALRNALSLIPGSRKLLSDKGEHFSEAKVTTVVALIVQLWPAITPALLAKVLFFADRYHLCRYGRPVTGVRYFAMTSGPMPACDLLPGELRFDLLSETDVAAVNRAVSFCREHSLTELSALTRQERAWIAAPTGGEMDLALLVPKRKRKRVRKALAYRM